MTTKDAVAAFFQQTTIDKVKSVEFTDEDRDMWKQIQNFIRFFHIFISLLNFSLIIAAICGPTWLYNIDEVGLYQDYEYHIGLWQSCLTLYDYGCPTESCINTGSDVEDFVQVTRSFLIIATIPALLAIIFSIAMICTEKVKGIPACICHLVTFVCVIIAMSVYTAETIEVNKTYGWTYLIGWSTVPMIFIGIVCAAIHGGGARLPKVIIEFRH